MKTKPQREGERGEIELKKLRYYLENEWYQKYKSSTSFKLASGILDIMVKVEEILCKELSSLIREERKDIVDEIEKMKFKEGDCLISERDNFIRGFYNFKRRLIKNLEKKEYERN